MCVTAAVGFWPAFARGSITTRVVQIVYAAKPIRHHKVGCLIGSHRREGPAERSEHDTERDGGDGERCTRRAARSGRYARRVHHLVVRQHAAPEGERVDGVGEGATARGAVPPSDEGRCAVAGDLKRGIRHGLRRRRSNMWLDFASHML